MDQQTKSPRFAAIRTRLTLVAIGLALGFAARWVGHLSSSQQTEQYFISVKELDEKAAEDRAKKRLEIRKAVSNSSKIPRSSGKKN